MVTGKKKAARKQKLRAVRECFLLDPVTFYGFGDGTFSSPNISAP